MDLKTQNPLIITLVHCFSIHYKSIKQKGIANKYKDVSERERRLIIQSPRISGAPAAALTQISNAIVRVLDLENVLFWEAVTTL